MKPVRAATSICDAIFSTFKVIRKLKTCTSITTNGNLRGRVGWLGSGLFEDVCRPRYNDRTFHFPLPTGNLFATLRGEVEKKIKCRLPESLNKLSMFSQPQLHLQQKIAIYQTQTGRFQPFFLTFCVLHMTTRQCWLFVQAQLTLWSGSVWISLQ